MTQPSPAPTRPAPRPGFSSLLTEYAQGRVALYGGDWEEVRKGAYRELARRSDCDPRTPSEAEVDKMARDLERLVAEQVYQMDEEATACTVCGSERIHLRSECELTPEECPCGNGAMHTPQECHAHR